MHDLADTTWEELHKIATLWGCVVGVNIHPNGYVEAGVNWNDVGFVQWYRSERAAINDLLSIIRNQIDVIVEHIEKERESMGEAG